MTSLPVTDATALRPKALSVLREARLTVIEVSSTDDNRLQRFVARVRGHHGVYAVDFDRGEWSCTCRTPQRPCGHIAAAQLITSEAAA